MTDHTRTEKIGGDSIFIFVVFQVKRETVMTAWQFRWGLRGSSHLIRHMLSLMLLRMLNLSAFYFCDVFMAFYFVIFE